MKKLWKDPAKQPPHDSTMRTEGDFGKFTDFMRVIVTKKTREKQAKIRSASPGPVSP